MISSLTRPLYVSIRLVASVTKLLLSLSVPDRVVGATTIHGRKSSTKTCFMVLKMLFTMHTQTRQAGSRYERSNMRDVEILSRLLSVLERVVYLARNCAASMNPDQHIHILSPPRPPPHVLSAPLGMKAVCGVRAGLVRCVRI
jgi:hypothetical protein